MNNNTKTVLRCPFCEKELGSNAALSAHIRAMHPDKWKGSVMASTGVPPSLLAKRTVGRSKGYKKKPIKNTCPACGYKNSHPPGMARHIQANHPDIWKGNLGSTLGRERSRPWKETDKKVRRKNVHTRLVLPIDDPEREVRLRKRRKYQKDLRARYYAEGRNSRGEMMPPGWKPRKWKNRVVSRPAFEVTDVRPEPTPPRGHIDNCPYCHGNIRIVEEAIGKGMAEATQQIIPPTKWHIA